MNPTRPSITADKLLEALISQQIITEDQLAPLLGEERKRLTLNTLELALISNSIISDTDLLTLKGRISRIPVLHDPMTRAVDTFPAEVSRQTGALVLDLPDLTVAVVEDLPHIINTITTSLGTEHFDLVLITASQFSMLYRSCYAGGKVDGRVAVSDMFEVFDEAIALGASDLHLKIGDPPMLRVHGSISHMERRPVDRAFMLREIERICGPEKLAEALKRFDSDLAYTYGSARFRINIGADRKGPTIAARKLPTSIPNLDDLNIPPLPRTWVHLERGLVLVTGPTGSGKSTTMAAILSEILTTQSRHVVTLEDPIEYVLPSGRGGLSQRERGTSFTTFAEGLRQALRQDPDVVFVGEMRDLETMKTAITAAETGHLVFGTLHTFDAPSTVARLVNSFPADEQDAIRAQLAYILKGVISQTLLPLKNGRGRIAAFEVMGSNAAIANNLRKLDGHNQIRSTLQTSVADGMQTMDMSLVELVKAKLVSESEAEFRARDLAEFRRRLKD